jgi:ATP-dependent Clp protease protease subunit
LPGLAIYDMMQYIKSDIVTFNFGLAASTASLILAGGTKGKRFAFPHSTIHMHQPIGSIHGKPEDILMEANQIIKIQNKITSLYVKHTSQNEKRIIEDLDQ